MNGRLLLIAAILGCCACAPQPLSPVHSSPQAPARAAAPAVPQASSSHGQIVGRVSTNPWHSIKDGGVVYLEDALKDPAIPWSATLDNHDMTFVPKVVAIAAGGSVIFTNTDPITHNVFTPDGEKWNLGEIPQNGTVTKRFDTPATYTILCNLHPSMLAYLVVAPSSYFARTDPDGAFAIKSVPPGTYQITAWVPRLKPVTQTITLTGEEATANFNLRR